MLKRYIVVGIFCCAVVIAPSGFARNPAGFRPAPLGLFGVSVGSVWSLPTCEDGRQHAVMCSTPESLTPDKSGLLQFNVYFPSAIPGPRYLKYGDFDVGVRDGVVQEITIFTTGVDAQNDVLAELIVKFGESKKCKRSTVQNGFGARFETADCSWPLKAGTLEFIGVFDDIDTGVIIAMTPEQRARENAEPTTTPRL